MIFCEGWKPSVLWQMQIMGKISSQMKKILILNKAFLDDLVFSGFQDFPANGKINKHNEMKNCHYRQNFFTTIEKEGSRGGWIKSQPILYIFCGFISVCCSEINHSTRSKSPFRRVMIEQQFWFWQKQVHRQLFEICRIVEVKIKDYGRPMKPFFIIKIQNFWAWTEKLGR